MYRKICHIAQLPSIFCILVSWAKPHLYDIINHHHQHSTMRFASSLCAGFIWHHKKHQHRQVANLWPSCSILANIEYLNTNALSTICMIMKIVSNVMPSLLWHLVDDACLPLLIVHFA